VLRYILLSGGEQSFDEVRRTILLHIPVAEASMASAGEQLIQQGFLRGIQQGVQKGIQQGVQQGIQQGRLTTLRETLASLIEVRFGAPSAAVTAVIEAAPEAELKRMVLRVTSAATAEDVVAGA
jgi:flagellar biosynthesis/type III secretory pathway protein FliH